MTCFLTQYSVYQLKIFLGGLWFLRQTITRQNGPQSTYKTITSGTFHFPISYILVEPITYQLLKQLSHLTTTLTSKWHDRWTNIQLKHLVEPYPKQHNIRLWTSTSYIPLDPSFGTYQLQKQQPSFYCDENNLVDPIYSLYPIMYHMYVILSRIVTK